MPQARRGSFISRRKAEHILAKVCVLVMTIFSSQVGTADLPVPVALYPFNGRHGTSDIGPNKNQPGKPANDVQFAPGPYGHPQGSYQFSGSSTSYIEIPNNGGLDTRYSMTILAWVNHEYDNGPIVNYGTNVQGFHFWIVKGKLFARPITREKVNMNYTLSPRLSKTWNYVGTTYDFSSGVVRVWVNGDEVAHRTPGSEEQGTQYDVRIGAVTDDPRYFKGRICCVQIYNKALSQQEINTVQNRTFWETDDFRRYIFGRFHPVFPVKQEQGKILATFTATTVVECLLRCSRMTECKSVTIEGININGGSTGGYCQLYPALSEKRFGYESHVEDKQFYNKDIKLI